MRKFRSDDTSAWAERFGSGAEGDRTIAASVELAATHGFYNSRITGNIGEYTAQVESGVISGTLPLMCLIHQTQGNVASILDYELNVILTISGTTATLKYPLQNTYVFNGTGFGSAQVVTSFNHNDFTINGSQTLSLPAWDGNKGGLGLLIGNGVFTNNGVLSGDSRGFRGFPGVDGDIVGRVGEGHLNRNGNQQPVPNSGNSGGGGGFSTNNPWNQGNGGAGGSNRTSGQPGSGTGGGNNQYGGAGSPGAVVGDTQMLLMSLGGAGGEGGDSGGTGSSGYGGLGGALWVVIFPTITGTGAFYSRGQKGGYSEYRVGGGGSGAGGGFLGKGNVISLGSSDMSVQGGDHVNAGGHASNPGDSDGGFGGDGYLNFEYFQSVALPSLSYATPFSRKDEIVSDLYAHEGVFNRHSAAIQQLRYNDMIKVVNV